MTHFDRSFPHEYDVAVEQANEEEAFGLEVEVTPQQSSAARWARTFPGQEPSEDFGFVSGVFSTPDAGYVCVVSSGTGYLIRVDQPESQIPIDCLPIRFVLSFPAHELLIFGNFTEFVAYGPASNDADRGLARVWVSARLGWDDLEIVRITPDRIDERAWSVREERMLGFSLDVRTGIHEGGAYEEAE